VITGVGVAATATLGLAGAAQAEYETYYVGSTADTTGSADCLDPENTTCTLRDAVYAANSNDPYVDYVVFASNVTGTVTLGGSDITIEAPVNIYGRGANVDTVSGNGNSRIFNLDMADTGANVRIYGLTLTDGYGPDAGGAILDNNADLTVVDSRLTGNSAYSGGAIFEYGGSEDGTNLFVAYSTIDHNLAVYGGGIAGNESAGFVGGSTLSGNTAYGNGGAIINNSGGYGVGLYDATISGNTAGDEGGGIRTFYAYANNTIIANNSATDFPDTYNAYLYGFTSLIRSPGSDLDGDYNITGTDPQLGALANNGGNTPTMRPAASSPVVDRGLSGAYYDQRGFNRHVDNPNKPNFFDSPYASDIGSVELTLGEGPQPPTATPAPTPAPAPGKTFNKKKAIKKCKKKFPGKDKAKKRKKCIKRAKRRARVSAMGLHYAAPAIRRWRAEAREHAPDRHWGDRAWKFDR
jgi:hypothetical protein